MLVINKPNVFYSSDPMCVLNPGFSPDINKINNLNRYALSVLDFSSEHYGLHGIDYVYHALEQSGVNFLLLVHDPADHKKFDRMFFYPHWYHWSRLNFKIGIVDDNRKYAWGCLNGNPRPHRIYNYFYSQQQDYFNSACFTFYNGNNASRADDVCLTNDVIEFWSTAKNKLPDRDRVLSIGPRADSICNLPALTDSYVHLVAETTVMPKVFVSEKTWKPIASQQLFLMFGNPGTISYLRNQGVDVFDDIIDHSYDSISDWQSRLHQVHKQLQSLISSDLQELYINTKQRRLANAEKFFSGAFDQTYQQTIEQCINTLN